MKRIRTLITDIYRTIIKKDEDTYRPVPTSKAGYIHKKKRYSEASDFLKNISPGTYLAHAKLTRENPKHEVVFFMGFKNGTYCKFLNNSYDKPVDFNQDVHFLEIKKKVAGDLGLVFPFETEFE